MLLLLFQKLFFINIKGMKKWHYFEVWAHYLKQLSPKKFTRFQKRTIGGSINQVRYYCNKDFCIAASWKRGQFKVCACPPYILSNYNICVQETKLDCILKVSLWRKKFDLRVSADAGLVKNCCHLSSLPVAILKIWHPDSWFWWKMPLQTLSFAKD